MRSELLLQLAGNPASKGINVDSEIGSSRCSSLSFVSNFSEIENDIGNVADVEQVLQSISEEELEKHFYGLCVRAKMSLPKEHHWHEKPISEIYLEVTRKSIPVSQWKEYISKEIIDLN